MRFFTLFLCLTIAFGQQTGTNTKPGDTPATFSATTSLVVEAVVVKDKSGKDVEGLTAKDFTITEDGVPQVIKFFDYEKLPETMNTTPLPPAEIKDVVLMNKLPHTTITTESGGNLMYRNRRLMALYFDMTTMPPPDQMRELGFGF